MKKLFFSLFIFSLVNAMQVVVERKDGKTLNQSELKRLAALSSSQITLIQAVLWVPNSTISKEKNTEIARKIEQKKAMLVTIIQCKYLEILQKNSYQLSPYAHNLHDLLEQKKNNNKE